MPIGSFFTDFTSSPNLEVEVLECFGSRPVDGGGALGIAAGGREVAPRDGHGDALAE